MENHETYSIEEFVLNPSFQAYALETNSYDKELWENYFIRHPEQVISGEKASNIIRLLSKANKTQSSTKAQDYKRFMQSIDRQSRLQLAFQSLLPSSFNNIARIAAVIALLITISGFGGVLLSKYYLKNGPSGICKTVVGKGQKSKVFLPDGTEVWLNSESTLTYATDFGNATRDVKLIGEAYFKVHKDKRHQFIVHIANVDIKVFGTEFNVKSYSDENTIETTLVTGSLSIQKISSNENTTPLFLKPNQRAVIYKSDSIAETKEVESKSTPINQKVITQPSVSRIATITPENVFLYAETNLEKQIAWKDQKLIFKDETFESVSHMLERWYDIKIVFESPEVQKYRFRGIFENETIEQALNAMRYTTPFEYTVDHRTIHIKARNDKR
ncbi:MAG: FecR family protein [Bacteroidetes bacterium]|nr:FecR family protein [Bacteroidota bacterium]